MAGAGSGRYVGVVGPGTASDPERDLARAVGAGLAHAGVIVVTGGLGGVMEAASRGAHEAGGTTLGLLPGRDRDAGNAYLTVAVPTGMGEMRNPLVVRSSDALIAIGGSWGTLSEIALAIRTGVPVIGLGTWELPQEGVVVAADPEDAVRRAVAMASAS